MPEGPEVKLTTEYLQKELSNKIISKWEFVSGQYENKYPEGYEEFEKSLPLIVEEVQCKGKLIYISCYNEHRHFYILHSLRMTGKWQNKFDEYCRWYIELDTEKKIWFRNPRCLATLHFTENKSTLDNTLKKLGFDVLKNDLTVPKWKELVNKNKAKNITSFLMKQDILSGIGNYLKAEILYYAKISPLRKLSSLKEHELDLLYEGIRIVPRLAYNNKGVSLRDYTNENGNKGFGEFHLKVYGRSDKTKTKTSDGRITYWDEKVQK